MTLFNRGTTNAELYPELERITGDRDGGLDGLRGREWDAVVDTSGYLPRVVGGRRRAARRARSGTTSSSRASPCTRRSPRSSTRARRSRSSPSRAPRTSGTNYGALKALCEEAVESAFPGRSTRVRAGLIVGPYDPTGRFTYWPHRIARGGDVLVPGPAWRPVQLVDVRDLAAWIVRSAEERHTRAVQRHGAVDDGRGGRRRAAGRRLDVPRRRGRRRVPRRARRSASGWSFRSGSTPATRSGGTSSRSTRLVPSQQA